MNSANSDAERLGRDGGRALDAQVPLELELLGVASFEQLFELGEQAHEARQVSIAGGGQRQAPG